MSDDTLAPSTPAATDQGPIPGPIRPTIPRVIQAEIDKMTAMHAVLADLTPIAAYLEEVQREFPDLPFNTLVVTEHLTCYLYPKSMQEVIALMRRLRRDGYKGTGRLSEDKVFHVPLGKIYLYCSFSVTADASCRLVETGKREVPIYELRCDDKTINQHVQDTP
jgi:hypothetical protein